MSQLAEVVVQEWLNRQGYFTMRGVRVGRGELDLIAVKVDVDRISCRHVEVQASSVPIAYVTSSSTKTLSSAELNEAVEVWVRKKYLSEKSTALLNSLCAALWTKELVVHRVKHPEELDLIREFGVDILSLTDIVSDLRNRRPLIRASGADLLELMHLTDSHHYQLQTNETARKPSQSNVDSPPTTPENSAETNVGRATTRQLGQAALVKMLTQRGLDVEVIPGNGSQSAVRKSETGKSTVVRCKASSNDRWPFKATEWMEIEMDDVSGKQIYHRPATLDDPDFINVLVLVSNSNEPPASRFFVIRSSELQQACIANYSQFMEKHGWRRPRTPDCYDCRLLAVELSEYEDSWEVIDRQLA